MATLKASARFVLLLALGAAIMIGTPTTAAAAGTSQISGRAFQDLNRNGVADPGEAPFAGHQLYLFDSAGAYLAVVYTAADGRYLFTGLTDGTYTVAYASPSWTPLRHDWAPTTVGSLRPSVRVVLATTATVDFGWRPIAWSTNLSSPISSYTGSNGLRTESFSDALAATDIYSMIMQGEKIGPEAAHTVARVGYGTINEAPTSIGSSNGVYNSFSSIVYISWNAWLDDAEATVFHEYGHSWSLYNAYLVQQDGTFASYLAARGLSGDARVGSSYKWSPGEMIAEDYRQLFAAPAGKTRAQANNEIPPAAAVAGLRSFLADTYTKPKQTAPPPPVAAPVISNLAMSPGVVTKSGTVSYILSAPATAVVAIIDSSGATVRTLTTGTSQAAGLASMTWNRTDDAGRRVRSGPYSVRVSATGAGGSTSATTGFTVK